jgi:sortase A
MRRSLRILGTTLVVAGALTLVWTLVVWQWQDPFTALYTTWKQRQLTSQYDQRVESFAGSISTSSLAAERQSIARAAKSYRSSSKRGQAIGRIRIPRMGVNMVLVNGTDHETLKKGPGRDGRTFMPGENRLIYIAGHRTTYLAPFSHIDRLRAGDRVTIEVPYGTFIYAVTRHRIVKATDLSVLRSPMHEVVELQACHPRFFASHRYIAYAKLLRVEPRGAKPYELTAQASGK